MKKVFLFFLLVTIAFTTNSCSNDDSSPRGMVTFKLDGVQKTLNIIKVEQLKNLEGTFGEYTLLRITASSKTVDESVMFSFKKGNLGNIISQFFYIIGGDVWYDKSSDFSGTVTANGDDKKIIGTFSGHVGETYDFNITEGTFNIQY